MAIKGYIQGFLWCLLVWFVGRLVSLVGVVGRCMVYGIWLYSATRGYNGSYRRFYAFMVLGIE